MRRAALRSSGVGAVVALVVLATAPVPAAADALSVEIDIDAVMVARPSLPFFWGYPSLSGTFEATGDVEDEGLAAAAFYMTGWGLWGGYVPQSYWMFTLEGENGSLGVTIHIQTGNWTVTGGTGDYAGATGSGTSTCEISVTGMVTYCYAFTLTGSVDV